MTIDKTWQIPQTS